MGNLSDSFIWTNDADETEFGQVHKPKLHQLVEFLRSERPLPQDARLWLADLLDPSATTTPMRLKIVKRTSGPNPQMKDARDRWIYERLDDLVHGQERAKLEAAIAQVAEELSWIDAKNPTKKRKPSRASLMKIWSEMRAKHEAVEQAMREADED